MKVKVIVASFVVLPLVTATFDEFLAVIVIVGGVLSTVTEPDPDVTAVPAFPAKSVKAIL